MSEGTGGPQGPKRPLVERIHALVLLRLLPDLPGERFQALRELISRSLEELRPAERAALDRLPDQPALASREMVARIRALLGTDALVAITGSPDPGRTRALIRRRAGALAERRRRNLLQAGLRYHFGIRGEADAGLLNAHLGDLIPPRMEVNKDMATIIYDVDPTGVPPGFNQGRFETDVDAAIKSMGVDPTAQVAVRDGIIGMLLLDGNNDSGSPTFATQISNRLWTYVQSPLLTSNSAPLPGRRAKDVFASVDGAIQGLRNPSPKAFYQELAQASRDIIDGPRGEVIDSPIKLNSSVARSLQNYGSGGSGSFELPALTGPSAGGGTDEIIPDHIRSVAMHYAALQLEIVGLFKVVDRNVEIFMNGQLPVANDMGGNALNAYYWDTINRMSESARWMQYTRVLGAKGGEVSKEVQPNTPFDDMFVRLLSALSEYDRQQRVADLLGNQRGLSLTAEHVRKAGRDLAANATLYGYGYSQFSAKRLQHHIQTTLNVLKLPDIQQAWGVQSAWQVVERVSAQEFHSTPNVVKYRTMAESGKAILDLVAGNASAWNAVTGKPLFPDPANPDQGSDITKDDQDAFIRHTEYWLAVNGIKDAQVVQGAEPADTAATPSIPSLDGTGPGNGHGADLTSQLQQMLNQGQTPSPEQLRKMVGI